MHIAVLADRLLRAVRQGLAHHDWGGLRPSHMRLVASVPTAGTTITELSEPLFMTKQAVGQFVAHLRDTGHLDLRADEHDRRRRVVVRTRLGDELVAEVNAVIAGVEAQWADDVGVAEYAVFRRVLEKLVGL